MSGDAVARNYAETLFELAQRHEGVEAFEDGVAAAGRVLGDARVREFLATPRVSAARKKAALAAAFGASAPTMLLRFLDVVVDKGRQRLMPRIAAAYGALLERHRGRRHVDVTVARPLSEEERRRLDERLSGAMGAEVISRVQVRPGIVGGVVVREGDVVYDGSLKRQLGAMRRKLMAAELKREE